jgi:hypothetical protein
MGSCRANQKTAETTDGEQTQGFASRRCSGDYSASFTRLSSLTLLLTGKHLAVGNPSTSTASLPSVSGCPQSYLGCAQRATLLLL